MNRVAFLAIVNSILTLLTLNVCVTLRAEEPVEKFLAALRDAGYYDVALDYLESIERRNMVSEQYRRFLPFEKAEILIASVGTIRDARVRDARLNEAQQILARVNSADASSEELAKVANYQGSLFLNRAKLTLALAASDRLTAAERGIYAQQARGFLQSSRENFLEAKRQVRELIDPRSPKALRIDPQDRSSEDRLNYFQTLYVNVRYNLATAIEQLADTYTPADPEYAQHLTEAAAEFRSHHEDYYSRYLAAWNARLAEARCYQKLNQHAEALKLLEEIFAKEGGAYTNLKNLAYQLACDSWQQLETYPAIEIAQRLEPVVESLNRTEAQTPNWLRVQLELAIALFRQSEEVRAQPGARARTDAEALRKKGSKYLRQVAKVSSPHRDRARELMSQWNVAMSEPRSNGEAEEPRTFEDARQRVKDDVSELENILADLRLKRSELVSVSENDRAAVEQTLENLSTQFSDTVNASLEHVNLALQLVDGDTPPSDINQLRYFQSYIYFASEQYFEAALIGEYMFTHFPSVEMTRQAMSFVIPSYNRLYAQAPETDREFEKKRLLSICTNVIQRWPGSDEAGRAAASLISLYLPAKEFEKIEPLFKQLPENFSGRSQLAAQYGIKLWVDYREKLNKSPDQAEALQAQREQAKSQLEQAVKLSSPENLIPDVALASRLLVDVYLDMNEVDLAVQALENSDLAPLDLVKQKHPVVTTGSLAESYTRETYRVALRVYLAMIKNSAGLPVAMEKMKGVLAAMRQRVEASDKPDDRRQLSQIYSLIANELLNQFEAKPTQEKNAFAVSLMGLLNSIERDSTDAETILWAGSTALKVANSLTELGLTEQSTPMFQQAVSALSRAEELGFDDNPQRDALLIELKRQRALALRGSQKFEDALNQFLAILDTVPQNVKVQIDAAATLQIWGVADKRARLLAEAIKGSHKKMNQQTKREANQIWGWEYLAKAARGKNDELFCQAIYHWAECLLENGLLEKDNNRVATALKLIETEESRAPGLNDPNWKPRLEALKQRIKQSQ